MTSGYKTTDRRVSESASSYPGGTGDGLLQAGGVDAKDGVQAVQQGYGGLSKGLPLGRRPNSSVSKENQTSLSREQSRMPDDDVDDEDGRSRRSSQKARSRSLDRSSSGSTIGSLPDRARNGSNSPSHTTRGPARSGSIMENVVDANGIRKVVLEMTSSSSNEEEENSRVNNGAQQQGSPDGSLSSERLRGGGSDGQVGLESARPSKKRRKRRKRQVQKKGEFEPLLGDDR